MTFVLELLVSLLIVGGGAFLLIGSIGMVKLPDLLTRLHAPTKATTLGVLLALARARYRGERGVRLFNRSVPEANIAKATWVVALAFIIVIVGVILLSAVQVSGSFHPRAVEWSLGLLFEVVSALGTVGLSTGITPQLNEGGKVLIMLLMFVGRLGPLTIAIAIAQQKHRPAVAYAEEQVMIG